MDLRELQHKKEAGAHNALLPSYPLPLGQTEDLLTTSQEVQKQVDYNTSMTQTPLASEPEVVDTETPAPIPSVKRVKLSPGKTYEESIKYVDRQIPEVIRRRANRWDTLCNLQIPANEIVTGWAPKINMDSIFIQNQTSSAGIVYVSSTQERLQGQTIRGKALNPGDSLTLEIEAGSYILAPNGATIDLIYTWYEEDESNG